MSFKIITLEQNYRSTQPILNLTNRIIKHAREKYSKTLFTKTQGDQKPLFVQIPNENYQSRFIVQKVLELREEGKPLDTIAILFRAGWHSNDLEIELASHNILFVKYGGLKVMEAAHIKDAIAYLRVVFNPMDSVSWLRILLLIEGIGPKIAGEIILNIVDHGRGLGFLKKNRFKGKKYHQDLTGLFSTLSKIQSKEIRPTEQVGILLKFYRPYLEQKYDDFNKRINDLDSLSRIAKRYNNLERFLSDITLEPLEIGQVDAGDKEEEKLVLSTIHSAKGLEWQTVFIIFCIDGYLPSLRSLDNEEDVEEERRLLYVAATRAKENLYLMRPQVEYRGRSSPAFSRVSRFLEEGDILEEYVEEWGSADFEGEEGREEN